MKNINFNDFLKTVIKYRKQGMFNPENEPKRKDCLDDELICAYVDDNVTEEEKNKVLDHIKKCRRCMFQIADLIRFKAEEKPKNKEFIEQFVVRKCFSCEKINLHKERYCKYCGEMLPSLAKIFCASCENPIRQESKYCPHCGERVGKQKDVVVEQINDITKSFLKKGGGSK